MCWKLYALTEDESGYGHIRCHIRPVHLDHAYAGCRKATTREKAKAWGLPDLLFRGSVSHDADARYLLQS
jgi:hypothetical protein